MGGHVEGAFRKVPAEERKIADCGEGDAALVGNQHGRQGSANLVGVWNCTSVWVKPCQLLAFVNRNLVVVESRNFCGGIQVWKKH